MFGIGPKFAWIFYLVFLTATTLSCQLLKVDISLSIQKLYYNVSPHVTSIAIYFDFLTNTVVYYNYYYFLLHNFLDLVLPSGNIAFDG